MTSSTRYACTARHGRGPRPRLSFYTCLPRARCDSAGLSPPSVRRDDERRPDQARPPPANVPSLVLDVMSAPQAYQRDPRVDRYIDGLPDWQSRLCQRLRDLVHAVDPEMVETIKRTVQPYFVLQGNVCALLAAKDHINLFLYDGGIVPDPEGLITAGQDNKTARTIAFHRGRHGQRAGAHRHARADRRQQPRRRLAQAEDRVGPSASSVIGASSRSDATPYRAGPRTCSCATTSPASNSAARSAMRRSASASSAAEPLSAP